MRACWLKWVGRDWSISADYIWLNYSGANNADTDRVDSQYLAVLMRANTHSLAAADTTLWTLIII